MRLGNMKKKMYIISVDLLEEGTEFRSLTDENVKKIAEENLDNGARIYDSLEDLSYDWNNDLIDSSTTYMRIC